MRFLWISNQKNFHFPPFTVILSTLTKFQEGRRDHLQVRKREDTIHAASPSMKLTSFFKCSSVGEHLRNWWPQNQRSHTAGSTWPVFPLDWPYTETRFRRSVMENISCARTKSGATGTNVAGPLANGDLSKNLCEATFITKCGRFAQKISNTPILVRYFQPLKGNYLTCTQSRDEKQDQEVEGRKMSRRNIYVANPS
jgi:hypothetical protein